MENTQTAESTTTAQSAEVAAQASSTQASTTQAQSTQTETKAEEGKTVVPEKYELSIPEGSLLDSAHLDQFQALAKAEGWDQTKAKTMWERETEVVGQAFEKAKTTHEAQVANWANEIKADKELGGEKLTQTSEITKRVLQKFGSPELIEALNNSGYGNFPPLVKFVHALGKAAGADTWVSPNTQGESTRDIASTLYPSAKS